MQEQTPTTSGAEDPPLPVTPPVAEPEVQADTQPAPVSEGEGQERVPDASPAETGDESEAGSEPAPEIDYTERHTTDMENETFRSAHEARHEETRRKEQSRLQPLYQGAKDAAETYAQTSQAALQHSSAIIQLGLKLEKDGIVDEGTFANAIAKHAPEFARLIGGQVKTKAYFDGVDFSYLVIAEELGDPALANEARTDLQQLQMRRYNPNEVKVITQNGFKTLMKAYGKKEREAGLRDGLKQAGRAVKNADEASGAAGGPDMSSSVGGSGRSAAELLRDMDWVKSAPVSELMKARAQVPN